MAEGVESRESEFLQEVLADALSERACMEAAGENTILHDDLIDQLREAIEREVEEMD